jgi:hypothetical protein
MAFNEKVGPIRHSLVDRGGPPRLALGLVGLRSSGKTTVETIRLEEVNQFACILGEPRANVVAAPCWVVTVEVSGKYNASNPSVVP